MFQVRHSMKFFQHLLKKGLCLFNAPERVYIWFQQKTTAVKIGNFNLVFSEQDSWLLVATHLIEYPKKFLLLQQGHLWKRSCLQTFRLTIMNLFFHPLNQCMLDSSHPFNTLDFRGWCLLPFSKSTLRANQYTIHTCFNSIKCDENYAAKTSEEGVDAIIFHMVMWLRLISNKQLTVNHEFHTRE